MKRTTVREKYDDKGRLTERVTTTEDDNTLEAASLPVWPVYPQPIIVPVNPSPITPWQPWPINICSGVTLKPELTAMSSLIAN